MSKDWVKDIEEMHDKYKFHDSISSFDNEKMQTLIQFRLDFLREELKETEDAFDLYKLSRDLKDKEEFSSEEIVDGLIDLCVVAVGTLDLLGVDAYKAWDEVHKANMSKERGIKPGRPNPLGMPDLMKPEGWKPPSHKGNLGELNAK